MATALIANSTRDLDTPTSGFVSRYTQLFGGTCVLQVKKLLVPLAVMALLTGCMSTASNETAEAEVEVVDTRPKIGDFSQSAYSNARQSWNISRDDFDGFTRYRPEYALNLRAIGDYLDHRNLMVYPILIVQDSGTVQYGWAIYYNSSDWIFFDEMQVIADGRTFSMPVEESYNKQTDVSGGDVVELSVERIYDFQLEDIKAIVDDRSATFRVRGSDGSVSRDFLPAERKALGESLQLFMGLSGDW